MKIVFVMMCVCTTLAGCLQMKTDTGRMLEVSMGFMTIKASDLPPECHEYHLGDAEELGAGPEEKLEVILVDLNGDGIDEWIIQEGLAFMGSGGKTYSVFSKAAVELPFKHIGELFGDHPIILSPMNGWSRLAIEGRRGGMIRYLTEFIWRNGAYHGTTLKVKFQPSTDVVNSSE